MNHQNKLLYFIENCPTQYHTAEMVASALRTAGYVRLDEAEPWSLADGGRYYIMKEATLVAFKYRAEAKSMNIVSAHSDSPTFRLNPVPDSQGKYKKLNVERYGGAINYTWFDRPLSLAGRVVLRTSVGVKSVLCRVDEDIAVIPSVAPHLSRDINSSFGPNAAQDLQPLYSLDKEASVLDKVAASLDVPVGAILSHDLYLYSRERGRLIGADSELILSPRIDDLASVYTALVAFLEAKDTRSVPVLAIFDNEEVGSSTAEGAASELLATVAKRIAGDNARYNRMIASSVMLSSDGAHAIHPNHPELSDPNCHPTLGGGVAIKYNANRRYATDAISAGILLAIAERAGIKLQSYTNRADLPGGSTLGAVAETEFPVATVDIGIPQLAMHSISETCAVSDVLSMIDLVRAFYSTEIGRLGDGFEIK